MTLTIAQLAEQLQVTERYVTEQVRRRKWPCARLGRQVRFQPRHVEQINALIDQPATGPAGATRGGRDLGVLPLTRRSAARQLSRAS